MTFLYDFIKNNFTINNTTYCIIVLYNKIQYYILYFQLYYYSIIRRNPEPCIFSILTPESLKYFLSLVIYTSILRAVK